MCTMSIIRPRDQQLRIAFNRDELLTRSQATPPRSVWFGDRQALLPIDPRSNGTWIAVNAAGLAMAVLNYNHQPPLPGTAVLSRGRLIPMLIHATNTVEAMQRLKVINLGDFDPFRLIIAEQAGVTELVFDGSDSYSLNYSASEPLMFTSSGLGDALVERSRRMLFNELIGRYGPTRKAQDLFQNHQWPSQPHLSVRMNRENARTVSQTIIELGSDRAIMIYSDDKVHGQSAELELLDAVYA